MSDAAPAPSPGTLDDYAFAHRLHVRYAELDPQRVVFNAHYLTWFDIALSEYLRAIGFKGQDGFAGLGTDIMLVNASIDWRGSAVADDEVLVAARVEELGRTSFRFRMGVFRGDALLVEGRLTYVHAVLAPRAPQPLPARLIDAVCAFERLPPARRAG